MQKNPTDPICADAPTDQARAKNIASEEMALSSLAFLGGMIAARKESSERAYARTAKLSRTTFEKAQNWVAICTLGAIGAVMLAASFVSRHKAKKIHGVSLTTLVTSGGSHSNGLENSLAEIGHPPTDQRTTKFADRLIEGSDSKASDGRGRPSDAQTRAI